MRRKSWFGKGPVPSSDPSSKQAGGVIILHSWPDLKHTFIQQIFIKRLFVQGTSGEGSLQPGPRPPIPPPVLLLWEVGPGAAPLDHTPSPAAGHGALLLPCPLAHLTPPCPARHYAQTAQPHLVGFSTSSAKEVPSLHSKVNFLRFSRRPWQQP